MTRRTIWVTATCGVASLILAAFGLIALDRSETIEREYPSYAAASGGHFRTGGWMPDYLPPSATRIRAAQNLDTNLQWLAFSLSAEDLSALLAQGTAVGRLPSSRAPFWLSWWPSDVEEGNGNTSLVRVILPGPPDYPTRRVRCIAADLQQRLVYAWSCDAEAAA
jgi:hypothetical protein